MTKTTEMKATLRAAGIPTASIRISHRYCGCSEAYTVKVLNRTISLRLVESLLAPYRRLDICPVTGEILGGGNTYISVVYR